jgi:PD-(D/E)XK nuclease superfamily
MQIEELVKKYHWLQLGADGVLEMYLDHHALSTFRQCEAAFELSIMANIKGKHKSWNLEFGIIFHKMVETFYILKKQEAYDLSTWLAYATELWNLHEMDEQFSEHKMFKTLGGRVGFIAMMGQYANHFAAEMDRLRVIGIEITFGKNKEVPLGSFLHNNDSSDDSGFEFQNHVRCYLTGRIDFLMDSGSAIGPLDHKTTAFIRDNPANSYDPQDGMTGYIYASQRIIKDKFPELLSTRKVDRIWMNFAQIAPEADAMKRFRRIPIYKTEYQLEEYRKRQLRTFHKIYDMLVLGERPDWNTSICNNFFHSECQFRNLHRQNTASSMLQVLNSDFVIGEPWNPETLKD